MKKTVLILLSTIIVLPALFVGSFVAICGLKEARMDRLANKTESKLASTNLDIENIRAAKNGDCTTGSGVGYSFSTKAYAYKSGEETMFTIINELEKAGVPVPNDYHNYKPQKDPEVGQPWVDNNTKREVHNLAVYYSNGENRMQFSHKLNDPLLCLAGGGIYSADCSIDTLVNTLQQENLVHTEVRGSISL